MSLGDLKDEMESLKEITVNDKNCKVEYFLGGNYKFLVPANQEDAYIWWDTSEEWSMIDAKDGARSLEEIMLHFRRKEFR